MNPMGIYIHTPFCAGKCNYCDFYSFRPESGMLDEYVKRLERDILRFGDEFERNCDTLYFGGGTPSLLGGKRIAKLVGRVGEAFGFAENSEITLEANPADNLAETLEIAANAGVNRLSLGVQSGVQSELDILGRRHRLSDVERTIADAKAAGFSNISLDLMIGIPRQTSSSLLESVDYLCGFDPAHISAYLLKIEPGTPFYASVPPDLPDEDEAADMYLAAVERLTRAGYEQYEISNFARGGAVSRHNMKYWTGGDYLGIGPAAHSMINGKRWFYPRDIERYLASGEWQSDGPAGGKDEYIMLRLRLSEGIVFEDYHKKFGEDFRESRHRLLEKYAAEGFALLDDKSFTLTPTGFLMSNPIIGNLL